MSVSGLVLIAANLVPLIGVVFYAWDPKLVLALFWIENLIIGAFNLLKMFSSIALRASYKELFVPLFFVIHYGLFCTVHGLLLWDLLDMGTLDSAQYWGADPAGIFELFLEGAAVALGFVERFQPVIWLGILALILSHFVSFIENFILRGEVFTKTINKLMTQPYSQIVVLHVGLILGAITMNALGSPVWLLAIIVLLKLIADFMQFQARRKQATMSGQQVKDI